jgi:hypothetical protein
MITPEIRQYIKQEITKALRKGSLSSDTANVPYHAHTGTDAPKIQSYDIATNNPRGFEFKKTNNTVNFYQNPTTGTLYLLEGQTPSTVDFVMGSFKNITLLSNSNTNADHIVIAKQDGTIDNYVYIDSDSVSSSVEDGSDRTTHFILPTFVGYSTTSSDFRLRLPDLGGTPATCNPGDICIAGGLLYVCEAVNTWVVK